MRKRTTKRPDLPLTVKVTLTIPLTVKVSRDGTMTIESTRSKSEMADKKRLIHLIGNYTSARIQEELAGSRDAPAATVKRYSNQANQAWDDINAEIDKLPTGGEV